MLVTFSCQAYANITMFGDIAERLLIMMGQSGSVPGAIVADDVLPALSRLEQELTKHKAHQKKSNDSDVQDSDDDEVSLFHRAMPLIALLKAAANEKCDVMWFK